MKHLLNNIPVSPRNVLEIGLNTDYTGNPNILSIDTDTITLPREAKDIIDAHIQSQGLFEGIPYKIIIDNSTSLEYYVDLTEGAVFRDYEIEVKLKKRNGLDTFLDNSNGLSFELMNEKGITFNTIDIPYVIIPTDNFMAGLSLSISIYVMTKESIEATQKLADAVNELIEATTPPVGITGPAIPFGDIFGMVVTIAAQLAYVLAIYTALFKMAQQMFELLFPKVRYYKGSTIKELIDKGCQYLGFTLQSNLLDSNNKLALMPVPILKEKKSIFNFIQNDLDFSFTKGYPSAQDSVSTLGELIRAVELMFNAKTKVLNGVVQIERRDYWGDIANTTMLPALNVQDTRQSEFTYNTDEAWQRSYIHYRVDYSDINTVDFFDPTDAEYHCEATNVINQDLVTIKGFNDIAIPFALAIRKGKLNWLETFGKTFFDLIDNITGLFGVGTSFGAQIGSRKDITQLSSQFYSTTKILYQVNGKQPQDYVDYIKASTIYDKYHKINEIQVNGYKIFSDVPIRLKSSEFISLLDNNFAYINGVLSEILTINYTDEESKAIISYRITDNYAQGKVNILTLNS